MFFFQKFSAPGNCIILGSGNYNSYTATVNFSLYSFGQSWNGTTSRDEGGMQNTVCAKRNAHLIPNIFVVSLGEGGQKFAWSIM